MSSWQSSTASIRGVALAASRQYSAMTKAEHRSEPTGIRPNAVKTDRLRLSQMTDNPFTSNRYEALRVEGEMVIYDRENHKAWLQIGEEHTVEVQPK